jgi:DNA-binding MarR family transcriptional regulator
MEDFNNMPGHLIRRVQQISTALFAEECGAFDLTAVQYAALSAIRHHDTLDATRLADLISFDRSTIGDVLLRLEGKGWIERHPSPDDRRVKLLRLSRKGREVLEAVRDGVERVQQRLLEPLESADRKTLLRLLHRMAGRESPDAERPLR